MEEKKVPQSGVDQVEAGFVEKSPTDILSAASTAGVVSPKEWADSLKSVGVDVPEKPEKPAYEGPSGVESVESGFTAQPEMDAVEELGAIRYAAAPQEVEAGIEKVEEEHLGPRVSVDEALLTKLQEGGYQGSLDDLKKLIDGLKDN